MHQHIQYPTKYIEQTFFFDYYKKTILLNGLFKGVMGEIEKLEEERMKNNQI